jgi:type I restriction enzyme R subunit
MLRLQLCVLTGAAGFDKLKEKVTGIAAALAESRNVPAIAAELELLLEIQTDAWWQDITAPELEQARRRLRGLVHLVEPKKKAILYTNFEDAIGEAQEVVFETFVSADAFAKFKAKARHFLKAHEDHITIRKLRTNVALTPTDLAELERMLVESGTGTPEEIERAKTETQGLGLFVRGLVGLDRAAAQQAFAGFLDGRALNARQIEFVQIIIENLTQAGVVEPDRLYESPYTRLNTQGVHGVFREAEVVQLLAILDEVRQRAVA